MLTTWLKCPICQRELFHGLHADNNQECFAVAENYLSNMLSCVAVLFFISQMYNDCNLAQNVFKHILHVYDLDVYFRV